MNNSAFFISPENDIISIPSSHIAYIIDNPEKFGYSSDKIKEIYKKYGEPIGSEAQSRHEILIDVIKKGWIRIRKYKSYWSISLYSLHESKCHLNKWVEYIAENPAAAAKVAEIKTGQEYFTKLRNILFFTSVIQK